MSLPALKGKSEALGAERPSIHLTPHNLGKFYAPRLYWTAAFAAFEPAMILTLRNGKPKAQIEFEGGLY
ncbi:hypothetical protein N7451_005462 [Penicillium sp. IBT 35674x]|nr:hypothetical protein N7451_005462 [Penicillium sp. IBT 35674x]